MQNLLTANFTAYATLTVGLLTILITWLRDLNRTLVRSKTLDELKSRQAFWTAWLEQITKRRRPTRAEIGRAESEIARCVSLVEELYLHWPRPAKWTKAAYVAYLKDQNLLRRVFLLHAQRDNLLAAVRTVLLFFLALGFIKDVDEYRLHEILTQSPERRNEIVIPDDGRLPDIKTTLGEEYERGRYFGDTVTLFSILALGAFHLNERAWRVRVSEQS